MKLKLLRWLLPAIVPAALMFGAASPAHAVSYNCDGPINPVPTNPSGSVEITVTSGDCVIDHDVTAGGEIRITVQNGSLDAKNLTSVGGAIFLITEGGNVKAETVKSATTIYVTAGLNSGPSSASIELEDVIANTSDVESTNANIMLRAQGAINTKNIRNNGTQLAASKRSGAIQIDVNMSGANNPFTIGGAGGIDGTIDTRSQNGGGIQSQRVESGIRITNGTANSTGGITVVSMANIKVRNQTSRSGQIELNARKGILSLPSGILDASEQGPNGAGLIYLFAKTISTQDGTIVRANQATSSPSNVHQVMIAAETIQYQGLSGLAITANGGGLSSSLSSEVYVLPQGAVNSTSNNTLLNLLWTRPFVGNFFEFLGEVHFEGGSNAKLLIGADGNFSRVAITGYPVTFTGQNITLQSRGNGLRNDVLIGYGVSSVFTQTKGISFFDGGTGNLTINVNGLESGNKGGLIQLQTDVMFLDGAQHKFQAQGSSAGDADGGQIIAVGTQFRLRQTATATMAADAALNGSGNAKTDGNGAVAIFLNGTTSIPKVSLGTEPGLLKITANGGKTGGNGGFVNIGAQAIDVVSTDSVSAVARGTDGDGGMVTLAGNITLYPVSGKTVEDVIKATGHGTGKGGKITAFYQLQNRFDFLKAFKVNGGANLAIGGLDGYIEFNFEACQQVRFGSTFPKSYWDCVNPLSPGAREQIPVSAMASHKPVVRNLLRDNNTAIFTFPDLNSYVTFSGWGIFGTDGLPPEAGGFTATFRLVPADPEGFTYVNVFQQGTLGTTATQSYDDGMYKEAAAHEVGHAIDVALNLPSKQSPYRPYVLRDFINLDYVILGADASSSTPRFPCKATPNPAGGNFGAAPFKGIKDLSTGAYICTGPTGTGNNPNSAYAGMSNTDILFAIDGIWNPTNPNNVQWLEGYAQTSAYRLVGSLGVRPMNDGVYDKGFFTCVKSWATATHNGQFSGPSPSPGDCATTVPAWYLPSIPR